MDSSSNFYAVLPLFLLMIIWFAILGSSTTRLKGRDLVSSTCNRTLYVEVCISSLRSDPQSKTSDLRGLANIALNVSIAHGLNTLSYIKDLKGNVVIDTNDQYMSRCLSDCIEEYVDAVQNLQDSVHALRIRDYETLNALVTAAMTDSDTCEGGFEEISGYKSPVKERNLYFQKLCSNFLAVSTLLS